MTRILIAGIRSLGKCPCPCCFILKDRVHNIGTASDIHQWKTLVRTDNIHRCTHVIATRRIIYEKHFKVDSTVVESILQKESWVPATVRQNPVFTILTLTVPNHPRTHSLIGWHHLGLTCSACCSQIWCTNLNWVFGGRFLSTFFKSLNLLMMTFSWSWINGELDFVRWALRIWFQGTSYWEIPSFGCNTVWHFSSNCSKMKKLAACNFENLLQVHIWSFPLIVSKSCHKSGAQLLYLMVSLWNRTIEPSQSYYLSWPTGMQWQNCDCTMIWLLPSWMKSLCLLERSSTHSARTLAPLLQPRSFTRNIMLDFTGTPKRPHSRLPLIKWLVILR